jgi:hypothetical protein
MRAAVILGAKVLCITGSLVGQSLDIVLVLRGGDPDPTLAPGEAEILRVHCWAGDEIIADQHANRRIASPTLASTVAQSRPIIFMLASVFSILMSKKAGSKMNCFSPTLHANNDSPAF